MGAGERLSPVLRNGFDAFAIAMASVAALTKKKPAFYIGIVAGLVVVRQERVRTRQFVPFLMRAGIEAPGLTDEKPNRNGSR